MLSSQRPLPATPEPETPRQDGRGLGPARLPFRVVFFPLLLVLLYSCDLTEATPVPASVALVPGAMELDALGATLTLSAVVRGEGGQALGGVSPEWESDDPTLVEVSPQGVVTARSDGVATISARVGDAVGEATIVVRQSARQVEMVTGEGQVAPAGEPLPEEVAIQALDRLGNPVPGATVRFEPSDGGGTEVTSAEADPQGVASTRWVLGPEPGTQSLAVTVGERHSFHLLASALNDEGEVPFRIRFQFLSDPTPAVADAFQEASARWEPFLREKLPPVLVRVPEGRCGDNAPALDQVVDDLLVLVTVEHIDGPGGTVALANPCFLREDGLLPIVGQLRIDEDDVDELDAFGILGDIVAHEVGHVLGLGSLWELFELLELPSLPDARGADTHFTGAQSIEAFDAVGGETFEGPKVPVENEIGGPGSRDRHWRQSVFEVELMTSLLSTVRDNALSRVTLASLADLGYVVELDRAEPFNLNLVEGVAPREDEAFRIVHSHRDRIVHVLGSGGEIVETLRW